MKEALLDPKVVQIKDAIKEQITDLYSLCTDIGHDELSQLSKDLVLRMEEPFLFVIVGEVKVGKSSFVNALLQTDKEVTKVAPDPCTDTIQQIIFGTDEQVVEINPYLKKIFVNEPILQDIGIVDTPGTNTIVDQHQEITERFIPVSDLIVFVFEAKNPYRQSAWEFLDYIHTDWRKQIIFVLQQKDLMSAEDLNINIEGVTKQALKKEISDPKVFAVSAKMELDNPNDPVASGFQAIRSYINQHITGGRAPVLKQQNLMNIAQNINQRIGKSIALRKAQFEHDVVFRKDIQDELDNQQQNAGKQSEILIENVVMSYQEICEQHERILKQTFSFTKLLSQSFGSIFRRKKKTPASLTDFIQALETSLKNRLQQRVNEGVLQLSDSVHQMAKTIDLKIQLNELISINKADIFADITERRNNVLAELRQSFQNFLQDPENFTESALVDQGEDISPSIATAGGVAVIGVMLTFLTNGAIFDITGGVLTTLGVLFAGATVGLKKRGLLKAYKAEVEKGKIRMESELRARLSHYVQSIKDRIEGNFSGFDQHMEKEKSDILSLAQQSQELDASFSQIGHEIQAVLQKF